MKKSILLFGMMLCFCLAAGTVMADTYNDQMGQPPMNGQMQGQPPMGGPQMNGGQGGQMQGQPPMGGPQMNNGQDGQMQSRPPLDLVTVNTDDAESISLLSEADSDSEVLDSIENGTIAEVLEEDGDYTKVNIKGTIGYVLTSLLSELTPEDGQEPLAKPEDGQEPPAKPEDGQEPPAKPENSQQTFGQPGGQMMMTQPAMDGADKQSESLEPGIQNFFKAFLNFLTGKNTSN